MVLIASVGVTVVGNGVDSGILVVPKRIEAVHMSQREREPRVLSPLSLRNGNPMSPEPIQCVRLMRVLPRSLLESLLLVVNYPVRRESTLFEVSLLISIWVAHTSCCVEHH